MPFLVNDLNSSIIANRHLVAIGFSIDCLLEMGHLSIDHHIVEHT